MLFLSLQLINQLLNLLRVKPLEVFSLRSELILLRLFLPANEFFRYFQLVSILGMTPVDPPIVSKPLASGRKYPLKAPFNLIHGRIRTVEVLIEAGLRLGDLLIATLSALPHYHGLELLNNLDYFGREEASLGVVFEQALQTLGFEVFRLPS